MTTSPIPLTTLPVGTTVTDSYDAPPDSGLSVTIDRSVTGGLNDLTSATTFDLMMQSSPDGVTWNGEGGGGTSGGILTDRHGQVMANVFATTSLHDDANLVRVQVTVGGPSEVVIAGSVTTS